MIHGFKLASKLFQDWICVLGGFAVLVAAYYGFRYIDAGATVDGIANIYLALQVLIIGYLCSSLAGFICARLFGMLGRSESTTMAVETWRGFAVAMGQRVLWLVLFYLLFSRSIGQ